MEVPSISYGRCTVNGCHNYTRKIEHCVDLCDTHHYLYRLHDIYKKAEHHTGLFGVNIFNNLDVADMYAYCTISAHIRKLVNQTFNNNCIAHINAHKRAEQLMERRSSIVCNYCSTDVSIDNSDDGIYYNFRLSLCNLCMKCNCGNMFKVKKYLCKLCGVEHQPINHNDYDYYCDKCDQETFILKTCTNCSTFRCIACSYKSTVDDAMLVDKAKFICTMCFLSNRIVCDTCHEVCDDISSTVINCTYCDQYYVFCKTCDTNNAYRNFNGYRGICDHSYVKTISDFIRSCTLPDSRNEW